MTRQKRILKWANGAFGEIANDKRQRVLRFVEEAVELAHAAELNDSDLYRMVERVWARPKGSIESEVAQCGLTLECLSQVLGLDLYRSVDAEFCRVRSIPNEQWKKRHEAKKEQGILE